MHGYISSILGAKGRRGLSGKDKIPAFVDACIGAGAPRSWIDGAESIGPLAEFNSADRWIESPVKNGIALIGDAAASSDPSWGCGLSLTLLDVKHLANALCATENWSEALDRYAKEHDEYYSALHRILDWMTELTWPPGPDGDQRRARVFPRMCRILEDSPTQLARVRLARATSKREGSY